MYRKEIEGSEKRKVIVICAEPLYEQRVEGMVGSARRKARSREYRQGRRKTRLRGIYYRRIFRGSETADCPILRKVNMTAREVLSDKASN